MAKKKPEEAEATAKPEAPAGKGAKEPKEGKKGKESQEQHEPKGEKGPKEGKGKAPKAPTAEAAPGDKAAPPEKAAPTEKAPAGAKPAGEEGPKKKGKAAGTAPPRGKKLKNLIRQQKQKILKEGPFPIKRAVGLLKQMKRAKFDETVEIHMALAIDTTQSDQMVRGSVSLPHGIGKSVRVVIFCQGDNVAKAKAAGADFAGSDDLIEKIQKENWLDFDIALATQDLMGKVSRLGKTLGPRGLMPTPKAGTVIGANADVAAAVKEFKAGKVEYRADKGGNVHAGVGKLSFDEDKLADNVNAFVDQIKAVKPTGVKGNYIRSITLTATMSPSIPLSL
jgi:large subunit ribosomal protein L1